jgi:hypothetical protein
VHRRGADLHPVEEAARPSLPIQDVAACVVVLHECRAEQMLDLEMPRFREMLTIGGVSLP